MFSACCLWVDVGTWFGVLVLMCLVGGEDFLKHVLPFKRVLLLWCCKVDLHFLCCLPLLVGLLSDVVFAFLCHCYGSCGLVQSGRALPWYLMQQVRCVV